MTMTSSTTGAVAGQAASQALAKFLATRVADDEATVESTSHSSAEDDEFDDDDYDYDSSSDDEEESHIAKQLVTAAFSGQIAPPLVRQWLLFAVREQQQQEKSDNAEDELAKSAKKRRHDSTTGEKEPLSKRIKSSLHCTPERLSHSTPALMHLLSSNNDAHHTEKKTGTLTAGQTQETAATSATSPVVHLRKLFESAAVSMPSVQKPPASFHPANIAACVAAYQLPIVSAVRSNNGSLSTIQEWWQAHGSTEIAAAGGARNRYGESVFHAAARYGRMAIVQYFMKDCGWNPRVACEAGRTALHDAAWTTAPNFDVVDLLMDAAPELLYVADSRGHGPLDYVPRSAYDQWNEYLTRRGVNRLQPSKE